MTLADLPILQALSIETTPLSEDDDEPRGRMN